MLNRVAARDDGILLSFAAVDVAAGLVAEPVGLVDHGGQHRHRIGHFILVLAVCGEGIAAGRKQLDPIGAVLDVLAHRFAPFLDRVHDGTGQWIRSRR
jgi:hypothetical protein